MKQRRLGDYGLRVGAYPPGPLGKITDVPGVTVGHSTVEDGRNQTGVTVVLPARDNLFLQKVVAASHVLNGYGKSAGLLQIEEMGTIETPIALTNTLNVGLVYDALIEYMIKVCDLDSHALASVNPVVCECNDASLNDIRHRAVTQAHLFEAIRSASIDFEEGDVGGGTGMSCHGLKGGIGSASRQLELDGRVYTLGVLVQTNHGKLRDLVIDHKPVSARIDRLLHSDAPDRGSIITILATDLPLSERQLRRVLRRTAVGLSRLGSYIASGSGEVMVGFTTANRVPLRPEHPIFAQKGFHEEKIDDLFRMAAECEEEAVLNAMLTARTRTSYDGTTRRSLAEFLRAPGIL